MKLIKKCLLSMLLCMLVACSTGEKNADNTEKQHDISAFENNQIKDMEAGQAADLAVIKSRMRNLSVKVDEAHRSLETLEMEIRNWNSEILPLLSNDQGRLIAANPTYVLAFYNLLENRPTVGQADFEGIQSILDGYKEFSQSQPSTRTNETTFEYYFAGVQAEQAKVNKALSQYQSKRQSVEGFLLNASNANKPASSFTLQEAIDKRLAEFADQQAQEAADSMEVAKKKASKTNASVQAKLILQQAQKDSIAADQKAELEAIALKDSLRVAKAADPAIQALYKPFLENGQAVPWADSKSAYWKIKVGPPKPVSYIALVNANAINSIEYFVYLGCNSKDGRAYRPQHTNDRPSWKFPNNKQEWDEYGLLHKQFRKLAPEWVKMGVMEK